MADVHPLLKVRGPNEQEAINIGERLDGLWPKRVPTAPNELQTANEMLQLQARNTVAGANPSAFYGNPTGGGMLYHDRNLSVAGMSSPTIKDVWLTKSAFGAVPKATAIVPEMQGAVNRSVNNMAFGTAIHENAHLRQGKAPVGDQNKQNAYLAIQNAIYKNRKIKESTEQRDGYSNPLFYEPDSFRENGAEMAALYGLMPLVKSVSKGMIAPRFSQTPEGKLLLRQTFPYAGLGQLFGMPGKANQNDLEMARTMTGVALD